MAVHPAASVSQVDVQAAINLCSSGDTVTIPAGTASTGNGNAWTTGVSFSIPITITGAGTANTIIHNSSNAGGNGNFCFSGSSAVDSPIVISGFTLTSDVLGGFGGQGSSGIQFNNSGTLLNKIIIHDIVFNGQHFAIMNGSNGNSAGFGVVYNCTFNNVFDATRNAGFHNTSMLTGTTVPSPAWGTALYMIYEDCTFNYLTGQFNALYNGDTEGPMNYMIRHCTITVQGADESGWEMHGDNHNGGTNAFLNGFGAVVHDNTWNFSGSGALMDKLFDCRGGVGTLIYNNVVNGLNTAITIRSNANTAGDSTTPTQTYFWNNTEPLGTIPVNNDGTGGTQGVNYFLNPPANYTEVTYPSPLRSPAVFPAPHAVTTIKAAATVRLYQGNIALPLFIQVSEADYGTVNSVQTGQTILPGPQTLGNANVVAIGWHPGATSVTSVTDSAGNTYTSAGPVTTLNVRSQQIWYALNIKSSPNNTVSVVLQAASVGFNIRVAEYVNVSQLAAAFDTQAGNSGTTTNPTMAISPTGSIDLLVAALYTATAYSSYGTTPAQTANWLARNPQSIELVLDVYTTSSGTYNANVFLSASGDWLMSGVALKAASVPQRIPSCFGFVTPRASVQIRTHSGSGLFPINPTNPAQIPPTGATTFRRVLRPAIKVF